MLGQCGASFGLQDSDNVDRFDVLVVFRFFSGRELTFGTFFREFIDPPLRRCISAQIDDPPRDLGRENAIQRIQEAIQHR